MATKNYYHDAYLSCVVVLIFFFPVAGVSSIGCATKTNEVVEADSTSVNEYGRHNSYYENIETIYTPGYLASETSNTGGFSIPRVVKAFNRFNYKTAQGVLQAIGLATISAFGILIGIKTFFIAIKFSILLALGVAFMHVATRLSNF